jgi:hypothetical protein
MRVELEHGQWATFRDDVEDIPYRDRRPMDDAISDETAPPKVRSQRAVRVLLSWLLTGWSLVDPAGAPRPLPKDDPGVLEEIRARDLDLLDKAADNLWPRAFVDFRTSPDPNRPGGSSNGSASAPEVTPPSSTPVLSPTPTGPTSSSG